ncbi:polyadenylate-binding protein-interacting protein 7 [Dorcoceras hygrometricum]|uniref:Polyadenylate-binding protein-interacting protein 7 n=1 Tax=Dorcoceras hygrometricum TaxID=472368 RepID=A0A2Z7CYF6_9LAMI|nr:polyadenylate-binding protein-interacting protein 7 [Dorcoceras hygrometricum]
MNLPDKGASIGDKKLGSAKGTLNPNAAEFVPFSLRPPAVGSSTGDTLSKYITPAPPSPGKAMLDRSESSVSNKSDEEAQRYWSHQLPDDITLDFKGMAIDDTQEINSISPLNLSSTDVHEASRYSDLTGTGFILTGQQGLSPHSVQGNRYTGKLKYPISSYEDYSSPTGFNPSPSRPWNKHNVSSDQVISREGPPYNGSSRHSFLADLSNDQPLVDNVEVNPLEFLASQFPGFAAESLGEVYFASGGDLNLTIEILSQLELQVDGGLNQILNPKALSAPNLSALDFPALSVADGQNGLAKFSSEMDPYRSSENESSQLFKSSSSFPSRGHTDFASVVRRMASQDSSIWKYDRSGSAHPSIGSSRSSQLASSHNGSQSRNIYADRLQNRGSAHASSVWLETGDAVASMYSEMREEARDHARIRNSYFEQARQAYLVGNKALAKELSIKGQLHNMHMKAAHGKAQESIYRQRNPDAQSNGRERMIDLHGLHVSEAIHVLKRELTVMKNTARSSGQCLLAYICVGTGHHTRGSRTPARLPTAVQRYLLEEEGLDYSEPQPGLLRVVIY